MLEPPTYRVGGRYGELRLGSSSMVLSKRKGGNGMSGSVLAQVASGGPTSSHPIAIPMTTRNHRARLGRLRRREAEEAAAAPGSTTETIGEIGECDSALGAMLIKRWSWGETSAAEVQRCAKLAYDDQVAILRKLGIGSEAASTTLKALASLGTWGRNRYNVSQELKRFLGEPAMPAPTMFPVPAKVTRAK